MLGTSWLYSTKTLLEPLFNSRPLDNMTIHSIPLLPQHRLTEIQVIEVLRSAPVRARSSFAPSDSKIHVSYSRNIHLNVLRKLGRVIIRRRKLKLPVPVSFRIPALVVELLSSRSRLIDTLVPHHDIY